MQKLDRDVRGVATRPAVANGEELPAPS
jgi:hypothetical protein